MSDIQLPVPIYQAPYWRVIFRPATYEHKRIPSVSQCYDLIEHTKVRLRGWPYPLLSHKPEERGIGPNWVASWGQFKGHVEYWRLYQSTQFLHLFSVREATDIGWRKKLEEYAHWQLKCDDVAWNNVRGFLSYENIVYIITEIYEFAVRLAQKGAYKEDVSIGIRIVDINNYVLTSSPERNFMEYHAASEKTLENNERVSADALVAGSAEYSLKALIWFFERLGWLNPSAECISREQVKNPEWKAMMHYLIS